jgi:glycosyltransferase involved in cell wall biosynthesis
MRILFLQRQPCIRALKYAHALRGRHPALTLGFAYQGRTLTGWYGAGDDLFDRWWRLPVDDAAAALARAVDEFAPDLIHSHNLPDTLTVLALEIAGGRVPVVHDLHDMQSLRRTPYEDGFDDPLDPQEAEARALAGASAVVAVSQEMLEQVVALHGTPRRHLVFANLALRRDLASRERLEAARRRNGGPVRVVYQGSLSDNGSHYDLREHFAAAAASGLHIDVYPNRRAPAYRRLAAGTPGMRLMDTLPPADLLQRLPDYDAGWAAFNDRLNGPHLDTALPNKVFEYLASGLPVIAGRHRALERLVTDEGVGIVLDRPGEAAEALARADLAAMRARVAGLGERFTVEGRIDALVDLYRAAVADGPRGALLTGGG